MRRNVTDHPEKPAFRRPPVDGTDAELEDWADEFVEALLGTPSEYDDSAADKPLRRSDLRGLDKCAKVQGLRHDSPSSS